jgi:hypothetical protein
MSLNLAKLDKKIREHVTKHVGEITDTYHQLITVPLMTGGVPMEILHVPPAEKRPFHTLVTMGMSQEALPAPKEFKDLRHVELVLLLPPMWKPPKGPVIPNGIDASTWPMSHLLNIAQNCHIHKQFLLFGMFLPNGDEPGKLKPFAQGVPFYSTVIWIPGKFGDEFVGMQFSWRKAVAFLSLVCLKKDETDAMIKLDYEALVRKMNEGYDDIADPARKSVLV